jgi:hypothetical protein
MCYAMGAAQNVCALLACMLGHMLLLHLRRSQHTVISFLDTLDRRVQCLAHN